MEKSMDIPWKTRSRVIIWSCDLTPGHYLEKTIILKDTCTTVSIAALFTIAKTWKQPAAAAAAKSLQSCPTLCNPIDGSPPGSPIPGILQARTLEWVAISFSNAWKGKGKVKSLSRDWLFENPWTAAHQAPLSMGFSRQEYWSGVPLPSPGSNLSLPQQMNG